MSPYLTLLQALGSRVGRKQNNGVMCKCPVHADDKHSLFVCPGDNGTALLKCYAGCESSDIVEALGLKWRDLFPPRAKESRTVIETYPYTDEKGKLLYEKIRFSPKGFAQRKPNGIGWDYKLGDVSQVLYRLPDVVSCNRVVYVTEGEKAANALAALGMIATSPGGAGKWRLEFSETLRGRHVVLLPDADQPGFDHCEVVSQALNGIAKSVRVVALPGLKEKQDVYDYLDAGGTRADLEALAKATKPDTEPLTLIGLMGKIEALEKEVNRLKEKAK